MKKKLSIFFVLLLFVCGAAFAQSAKFSAAYAENPIFAYSEAVSCEDVPDPEIDPDPDWDFDINKGVLLATMKMPNQKEILAGVSAESGIVIFTKVKGKQGGSGVAYGSGKVQVYIKAFNLDTGEKFRPVPNGRVVLNARAQMLGATLGGYGCEDVDGSGVIDPATECFINDEDLWLLTSNQSANHFNVVFENLTPGNYLIKAKFKVISATFADATENACAYATSFVVLGDRIVTLQDVRAVKPEDPLEP